MDVNEYYNLMGQSTESDVWEMPEYNTSVNGKLTPITGPARKPALKGKIFKAPVYNDAAGHPIINNDKSTAHDPDAPVYRPSGKKTSGFKSKSGISLSRKVYMKSNFLVEIPGLSLTAGFTKVSGLDSEFEIENVDEGGYNGTHFFPKKIQHPRLVLEYGTSSIDWLKTWFSGVKLGMMVHLPIMIFLLDQTHKPVNSWMVMDAIPMKYSGPEFEAVASEVAITRMEFTYSGLTNIPLSIAGLL